MKPRLTGFLTDERWDDSIMLFIITIWCPQTCRNHLIGYRHA